MQYSKRGNERLSGQLLSKSSFIDLTAVHNLQLVYSEEKYRPPLAVINEPNQYVDIKVTLLTLL